jgi:acyl CoA:acetate/3-ketoacid CoA transferase beta subunit
MLHDTCDQTRCGGAWKWHRDLVAARTAPEIATRWNLLFTAARRIDLVTTCRALIRPKGNLLVLVKRPPDAAINEMPAATGSHLSARGGVLEMQLGRRVFCRR